MSIIDDYADIARRMRGKTEPTEEVCDRCDGGGWVMSNAPTNHPPAFEECPHCHNPEGYPCP
jgi:hypothetical protein